MSRLPGPVPPHGDRRRYLHRNPKVRCRCALCRRANADYQALRRSNVNRGEAMQGHVAHPKLGHVESRS